MVSRVLRDLGRRTSSRSWSSTTRRTTATWTGRCQTGEKADKEQKEANEEAGVWFTGLQAIAKHVGIKQVCDLSATPFYLKGSGYNEGYIFPWTVSDFSLMDAIESGIVKVPRTPVDDDADRRPRHLPAPLGLRRRPALPKRAAKDTVTDWLPPKELEGALRSLHRSYEKAFAHWEKVLAAVRRDAAGLHRRLPEHGRQQARLRLDRRRGRSSRTARSSPTSPATSRCSATSSTAQPLARPRTILIDSAQLESGEGMKDDFKQAAAAEIAAFKAEYRRRNPGADVDKITDEDLLREVMNTVGKKGKLGEQVRCVVSVSMLTEGWDANTVTPHPRRPRVRQPAALRAGRRPRPAAPLVRRERRRATSSRSTPTSTASRSSSSPPTSRSWTRCRPSRSIEVARARGPRGPADHLPEARRLPGRAPRRGHLARPRRRARVRDRPEHRPDAGSRWAASSASASSRRATRRTTGPRRSPSLSPSASSTRSSTPPTTSGRGSSRSSSRSARTGSSSEVDVAGGYSLGYLMTITEAQVARRRGRSGTRSPGRWATAASGCARCSTASTPTARPATSTSMTRKRDRADREVRGLPRHPRRQGRQHLGAAPRQRARAEQERARRTSRTTTSASRSPTSTRGGATPTSPTSSSGSSDRTTTTFERTLIIEVSGSQKSPGPTQAEGDHRPRLLVRGGQQPRRLRPLGLHRDDRPASSSRPGSPRRSRLLYDDAPIIGDPDLLDFDELASDRSARGA